MVLHTEMSHAVIEGNSNKNTNAPHVVDEFPGFLQLYSDGSICRSTKPPFEIPVHDDGSVLWKDVVFDDTNNLQLRLYKPASDTVALLPILYYIHGGGFCFGSRAWPTFHNYCLKLASELQAVVISPDYRLAPENRLPAAVDDGYTAVKWLQTQTQATADAWLGDVADFNRVFISGDSSGGSIAHNLAVRLGPGSAELSPVRVRGYVYFAPFFGGSALTNSEVEASKDASITLEHINRFWRLSLPLGENMDHPLVNPFGPNSPNLEKLDLDPILVVVGGSDLLKDRVANYANNLKKWGKKIEYMEFEGQEHGFFTFNPDSEPSRQLMVAINKFIEINSV